MPATVVYVHGNGNKPASGDPTVTSRGTSRAGPASRRGVTEIQDLVTTPLRVPDGVTAWRNVADGRDLVALDRTIRPEYAPADRTTDFLVVNDSENHHGIRQYLSTAPVRDAVHALVG